MLTIELRMLTMGTRMLATGPRMLAADSTNMQLYIGMNRKSIPLKPSSPALSALLFSLERGRKPPNNRKQILITLTDCKEVLKRDRPWKQQLCSAGYP